MIDAHSDAPAELPPALVLSRSCRFTDCRHGSEPGCAVTNAVSSGTLDD